MVCAVGCIHVVDVPDIPHGTGKFVDAVSFMGFDLRLAIFRLLNCLIFDAINHDLHPLQYNDKSNHTTHNQEKRSCTYHHFVNQFHDLSPSAVPVMASSA